MFQKIRKYFLLPLVCLFFTCALLGVGGLTLGIHSIHADAWYGWALLGLAGASHLLMTVVALPSIFTFVKWFFLKTFRSDDTHSWELDRFYWPNLGFVIVTMTVPWYCLYSGWLQSFIASGVALACALPLLLIKAKR